MFSNKVLESGNMRGKIKVIDVTDAIGAILEEHGFGSDSNNEKDIAKAGIWDLCDALSGKNNSKFSVEAAREEMKRRGV